MNMHSILFAMKTDSESIVEFAKELREELNTLVDESVLTLPSKNL